MNVFRVRDTMIDASAAVRRAISQMDTDSPAIQRVLEATRLAKFVTIAPHWLGDATCHVAIPKRKLAIFLPSVGNGAMPKGVAVRRRLWEVHGWRMLYARRDQVMRCSAEALAQMLRDAAKGD